MKLYEKTMHEKKVNPTKKKSLKEVKSADSIKKNHESFKGKNQKPKKLVLLYKLKPYNETVYQSK